MYPPSVEYIKASSLEHASSLLEEHGDNAHLLAGGQSLVPLLKFRVAVPDVIIDISQISIKEPVTVEENNIVCHALATHDTIHSAESLRQFDVIQDALPQLADPQVRNLGTIGGSLAEADPSGDWSPLLFLLDGSIKLESSSENRTVSASDFFCGPFQTTLGVQEIITSVAVPRPSRPHGGAYLKLKQRQGVYATASVGVQLELNQDGTCRSLRVTASAIQSMYEMIDVSEIVRNKPITNDVINDVADRFASAIDPIQDTRGSVPFKRNLCRKLCERAIRIADQRVQGNKVSANLMEVA